MNQFERISSGSSPKFVQINHMHQEEDQNAESARQIEVFFDGECPLCRREIDMLRALDAGKKIIFTDICGDGFEASCLGLTHSQLMERIYGRLPDGSLITGVEVFRRLYGAVGFKKVVAMSRWPAIRQSLDFAYDKFARHRLKLTGRCNADSCEVPLRRANQGGAT